MLSENRVIFDSYDIVLVIWVILCKMLQDLKFDASL